MRMHRGWWVLALGFGLALGAGLGAATGVRAQATAEGSEATAGDKATESGAGAEAKKEGGDAAAESTKAEGEQEKPAAGGDKAGETKDGKEGDAKAGEAAAANAGDAAGAAEAAASEEAKAKEPAGPPTVVFETSLGHFKVRLFDDKAPISAKNMLDYVDAGFYDGTVFHRVIGTFMLQAGGFDEKLQRKPTQPPIKNEATNGLKNVKGTLAMARTSVVDSATSQFFINVVDNPHLDHRSTDPRGFGYAVFGEIIEGMDVVEKIREVPTHCPSIVREPCQAPIPRGMRDVPKEAVVIKKVRRE